MIRTLKLDPTIDKYVLYIENEGPLEHNGEQVGTQTNTLKQVWDKDKIDLILEQVKAQEKDIQEKLTKIQSEIKQIPKMTDREKQNLVIFKKNMEKVQMLQKLQQLESNEKAHLDGLEKVQKDLKEIEDAIK